MARGKYHEDEIARRKEHLKANHLRGFAVFWLWRVTIDCYRVSTQKGSKLFLKYGNYGSVWPGLCYFLTSKMKSYDSHWIWRPLSWKSAFVLLQPGWVNTQQRRWRKEPWAGSEGFCPAATKKFQVQAKDASVEAVEASFLQLRSTKDIWKNSDLCRRILMGWFGWVSVGSMVVLPACSSSTLELKCIWP